MKSIVAYTLLIIWVSYLISASLLLFVRGFLLNRSVLQDRSTCQNDLECPSGENTRVILLLVDALRYDFVKWQDVGDGIPFYRNKMVYLNKLFSDNPSNFRLYKFIADPPTTTLQRIKGLTTGTLPTFIDVSSNFGTSEIDEDNLLDQLNSRGKKIVFLGDDTWSQLYHGRFLRQEAYPSLNVWDLDTVDNGVIFGLNRELNATDWSLIIGHMLGVDHVGHTYGASHPLMSTKLEQTDLFVRNIVHRMDNKSVLFIFGDHGMTESGDHGGSSDLEVTSALIVYSHNGSIIRYFEERDKVNQIDIVPTLSQLMGIPVPFSNLGRSLLTRIPEAKKHFRDNARQVYSYLIKYSRQNSIFGEELGKLTKEYELLEERYLNGGSTVYIDSVIYFIEKVQNLCRSYWVQFDYYSMFSAVILLFFTILFVFILITCIPPSVLQNILDNNFFIYGFSLIIIALVFSYILYVSKLISNIEIFSYFSTVSFSLCLLLYIIMNHWTMLSKHFFSCSLNLKNLWTSIFCVFSCLALFSNSFVVNEHLVIFYLLSGHIWVSVLLGFGDELRPTWNRFFTNTHQGKSFTAAILFCSLIKFSTVYWECREEHGPNCIMIKDYSLLSTLISSISVFALIIGSRIYLNKYNDIIRNSSTMSVLQHAPFLCLFTIICSWGVKIYTLRCTTERFLCPGAIVMKYLLTSVSLAIPSIVIMFTLLQRSNPSVSQILTGKTKHGRLALLDLSPISTIPDCSVVDMINLFLSATLILSIITGESRAITIVFCVVSLCIVSCIFRQRGNNDSSIFWQYILAWSLSSWHWFYSTGHQPTFPNIRWNVVELTGGYFGGLLILTETFSSQVIHGLVLVMPAVFTFGDYRLHRKQLTIASHHNLMKMTLSYILVLAFRLLACITCSCIHSRHLMVWKIFAPKLIFEGIGFIFSLPFLIIGFLFVVKISVTTNLHLNKYYS